MKIRTGVSEIENNHILNNQQKWSCFQEKTLKMLNP